MLQAGSSRVRFPDEVTEFLNLSNPSSRTMALGSTQSLIEMSTRNLPGGTKFGSLDISKTYGPPRRVTGIALPFYLLRDISGQLNYLKSEMHLNYF
jgi:hypothetical protein